MIDDASKELPVPPPPPPQGDVSVSVEARFELARSVVVESARYVASEFGTLDRHQRLKLIKSFRAGLIPRKAPGRKRRKEITAAYGDWNQGMKGLPLYRKHIPGFDALAQWRREKKSRALMDAIRTRKRRGEKAGEIRRKLPPEGSMPTALTLCEVGSK